MALGEKGATVHTSAEISNHTDFLQTIPAFSTCSRAVLEEFVTHSVVKVHCAAGKKLNPLTEEEQNLYIVSSGLALLITDDVTVILEPGDYFGRSLGHAHHVPCTVSAVSDMELLVLNPSEVARLQQASSRECHPSRPQPQDARPVAVRRPFLRQHRRPVLVG
jgi:CRP-like cAMP-binding protein